MSFFLDPPRYSGARGRWGLVGVGFNVGVGDDMNIGVGDNVQGFEMFCLISWGYVEERISFIFDG